MRSQSSLDEELEMEGLLLFIGDSIFTMGGLFFLAIVTAL